MKRILFVDDEAKVLRGLERQLHVYQGEWDMHFANCGREALDFLHKQPVEIVVTDMMMPGMDGAQLLTEIKKLHPETIRIVLSGQSDRESVMRLVGPAHQYLSKPCNNEELRTAIRRAFAARELLADEALKKLVSSIGSLPTLPGLYAELSAELQKPEPSVEVVSGIVTRDIAMTVKLLQLVNSAFFGLPKSFTNVRDAVNYLGVVTIQSLVLSLHVFSQDSGLNFGGFSIEALAQHCWKVGAFSRQIAQMEHCGVAAEQFFLAGLLHDMGQLILASNLPERYAAMIQKARANRLPLWVAETEEFGASHAEVGAYLLGLWGMSLPVVDAVAFHHRPEALAGNSFSAAVGVHVADALVHEQDGAQDNPVENQINLAYLKGLGLASRVEIWRERCSAKPATKSKI